MYVQTANCDCTVSPSDLPAAVPWSPGGRPLVQDVGNLEWTKQAAARTLLMRCQSSADSSVNNIQSNEIGQTNDLPRFFPPGSRTHLTWDNLEPRITKTLSFCPALVRWPGDWNVLVLYVAAAAVNADSTKDRYQFYISNEFPPSPDLGTMLTRGSSWSTHFHDPSLWHQLQPRSWLIPGSWRLHDCCMTQAVCGLDTAILPRHRATTHSPDPHSSHSQPRSIGKIFLTNVQTIIFHPKCNTRCLMYLVGSWVWI